jgi:GTP diphosphokinase / guanosine-3',5'-bis(diphosphate) 3'-diphosphatase
VRKDEQVKTASKKSLTAKLLKLADKTSNLRAVAVSPPADWSVRRKKAYVDWSRELVNKGLRGANQKLEEQFDQAAAAAERSFNPTI